MRRPVAWRSQRGLLLLEAVLSALVIAVGLVVITRGLSGQLRALRTLEESDVICALAQSKLIELEAEVRNKRPPRQVRDASFDPPYGEQAAGYRWSARATPLETLESPSPETVQLSQVTVTIQRRDGSPALFTLHAVWPKEWIPSEWQ